MAANDIGDLKPQTYFEYNGKYYAAGFEIYNPQLGKDDIPMVLNNNCIQKFEFVSELNKLLLEGTLEYADEAGQIGKIIGGVPYSDLLVYIQELKRLPNDDGTTKLEEDPIPIKEFKHRFTILNFEITDRVEEKVTYKMKLVSTFWYRMIANIAWSNYDKEPMAPEKNPFQIIKNLLVNIEAPVDDETFKKVILETKDLYLDYATKRSDNTMDAIDYVLYRTMYNNIQDENLKFIRYDYIDNLFKVLDIKYLNTYPSTAFASAFVSLLSTKLESEVMNRNVNFGTLTKKSITEAQRSLFDTGVWNYDIETNSFVNTSLLSEELRTKLNAKDDSLKGSQEFGLNVVDKFPELNKEYFVDSPNWSYKNESALWDNQHWIYKEFVENILFNDSLIIETAADLVHQAGTGFQIEIDKLLQMGQFESKYKEQELKIKQAQFSGMFFVARARHMFCPKNENGAKPYYNEDLVLARNFILDPKA